MSATRGNGDKRWSVDTTDVFDDDQARLEADYPRLGQAFSVVRRQFEVLPTYRARALAGETWLYRTRQALGAPAVFIYYEIWESERQVTCSPPISRRCRTLFGVVLGSCSGVREASAALDAKTKLPRLQALS